MLLTMNMAATYNGDDAALVEYARLGNSSAFDQLYLRHRDRVYTLCLNLCGNHEEARDLLQETFVNAWRGLPKFAGRSAFSTWLHSIAVNVCRAARRRRKVTEPTPVTVDDNPVLADCVHDALALLQPKHRILLVLRYSQGLSYQEIGECLDWSLGKVKITLHRARLEFKEAYKRMNESEK
ncbi:MAG: sigma-70 family RNA polymerase sigma factor [Armatimonadetes bacterium]|nr:sigma-70 family RNA polymerase sigma factor [Armatimonadota bacterium]NIM23092.1 sigma-70 family RNA polymerase sigma factor [Armatimonadota bacterium]NIM66960.1 sigma-70 family RNA polymerase sigma factor [Armatimonadota bacterium]NIM75494.1 sigma-70 family RNA polymerase sigma factor [Armatimonadota bacterium]NIN05151.1 sigma-70 family RNA polymerase sigma factor [Armatimonadota bacterium]